MAKDRGKISKNDKNLSALIADHNLKVKSAADDYAAPERGYQKSND